MNEKYRGKPGSFRIYDQDRLVGYYKNGVGHQILHGMRYDHLFTNSLEEIFIDQTFPECRWTPEHQVAWDMERYDPYVICRRLHGCNFSSPTIHFLWDDEEIRWTLHEAFEDAKAAGWRNRPYGNEY